MDSLKNCVLPKELCTGHDVYIAGDVLRDYLLNRDIKAIDLVVEKDGLSIAQRFSQEQGGELLSQGKKQELVRVVLKDKNLSVNIVNMQGRSILEHLGHKDFTINALACKVNQDGTFDIDQIIDPFGGREDLKHKKICMIHRNTFQEAPLNMLRAVGLMAELGFDLEEDTAEAIRNEGISLKNLSPEEISYELFRLLNCKETHYYLNIMDKHLNLLNIIFPEIEPMKEVGQCKYHVVDAWTHSLYTLNMVETIIYAEGYFESHLKKAYEEHTQQLLSKDHTRLQLIKLAALFHDIGKPSARWVDETGRVRFKGHEITGMEIAADIAERLRFSQEEKQFLCKIVKEHMWPLNLYKQKNASSKGIYDLFEILGEETLDVLLVSLADIIATRKLLHPYEDMGVYKAYIESLANDYLTRYKGLMDTSNLLRDKDIWQQISSPEDRKKMEQILDIVRKTIFLENTSPEGRVEYVHKEIQE